MITVYKIKQYQIFLMSEKYRGEERVIWAKFRLSRLIAAQWSLA
jgi:hypothetical protein